MNANRVHYFVVAGRLDADGNIHLEMAPDVDILPGGPIWDEATEEWSPIADNGDCDRDDTISAALRRRLAATEVTA